jgi:hypothetical protein
MDSVECKPQDLAKEETICKWLLKSLLAPIGIRVIIELIISQINSRGLLNTELWLLRGVLHPMDWG